MGTDTPTHALIVWEMGGGGGERSCLEGLGGEEEREGTIELIAYELHSGR